MLTLALSPHERQVTKFSGSSRRRSPAPSARAAPHG